MGPINTADEREDLAYVLPDDELVAPASDGPDEDALTGEPDVDDELPVDVF